MPTRFILLLTVSLLVCACGGPDLEERVVELEFTADTVRTLAGYDVSHWKITTDDLYAAPQKMTKHHVLGLATLYCDPVLTGRALADGADPDLITVERLPIMEAAMCTENSVAILDTMLRAGLDVNTVDYNNESLVSYAIYGGDTAAVGFLLDHGADPLLRDSVDGFGCPAVFSVQTPEMLHYLLSRGITLDQGCVFGKTLLHSAAENDNAELIEYILEHNLIHPQAIDVNEMSAWDYATNNAATAAQDLLRPYR